MGTIYTQGSEGSTSLASGINFDSGWSVDATGKLSGNNSLSVASTGAKSALYATQDGLSGNLTVSARFRVDSPGASSALHLVGRLTDATPANFTTGASSYRAEITLGSSAAFARIVRRNAGTDTALFTSTSAVPAALAAATAYVGYLTFNGSATAPGTKLTLEIQRVSDGQWLTAAGAWQPIRTWVADVMDATPLAGQGYSGLRADLASGATLYADDFTLTDYLDPTVNRKVWTDNAGWTAGLGTIGGAISGFAEANITLAGDGTQRNLFAAINDRQWGNTSSGNVAIRLSGWSSSNNTSLFAAGFRFYLRGAENLIKLDYDSGGANIASFAFTYANFTADRMYRIVWDGTPTRARFALIDNVTGFYLRNTGSFAAGEAWCFDQTVGTAVNPGSRALFTHSGVNSLIIGTYAAGPAGAAAVTPNPATLATGAALAFAPVRFDGTDYLASTTIGTFDLASNTLTAPGAAGSGALTYTSKYIPSDSVAVPITVNSATNAAGYTLAASPASTLVGSPVTITATLTGGTSLASSLVITLADSLGSTIAGTITIANGSTTGSTTVTPTALGSHSITATHAGGGFAGGDGSTGFAAVAALALAYVSSAGSDANAGGTTGAPFLTIGRAVAMTSAGALIRLNGGDTFAGPVDLTTATGGRAFNSYGTGRATVQAADHVFGFTDVGNWSVDNLTIAETSGAGGSIPIKPICTDAVRRQSVSITNCTITGGIVSIRFGSFAGLTGGWNGITISGNTISGASGTGIYLAQAGGTGTSKHYSNVLIENNTVRDITGANMGVGAGIILGYCDSTTGTGAGPCIVRFNHVYNIGLQATRPDAGPGGIYPIYSDGVSISDNLIHDVATSSGGKDGSPLDFDIDTSNCVFERNYCYDCQGSGLLLFSELNGNVCRWNVFVNCSSNNTSGFAAGVLLWGGGSLTVHNNIFWSPTGTSPMVVVNGNTAGYKVNKRFYNNIFAGPSGSTAFNTTSLPSTWKFEGNSYTFGGANFKATVDGVPYTDLPAFRTATAGTSAPMETGSRGFVVGSPFAGIGSARPTLSAPSSIPTLTGFRVPAGSPLAAAGLDLQALFAINPGSTDFLGETISAPYSVGSVDAATNPDNATGYTLTPSASTGPVGSPVTITATLTGGTALSAPLVITLADTLGSTIAGTITIANGSTAGSTTVTPTAAGIHQISATHAGGGFAGGDGVCSFTATALATPGFTLSLSTQSPALTRGGTVALTVTAAALNGFNSAVALSASGLPAGVSASFNPASIAGGSGTSTLTLSATGSAAIGAATIGVTGSGGSVTQTPTATLTVGEASSGTSLRLASGQVAAGITPGASSFAIAGAGLVGPEGGYATMRLLFQSGPNDTVARTIATDTVNGSIRTVSFVRAFPLPPGEGNTFVIG